MIYLKSSRHGPLFLLLALLLLDQNPPQCGDCVRFLWVGVLFKHCDELGYPITVPNLVSAMGYSTGNSPRGTFQHDGTILQEMERIRIACNAPLR